MTRFFTLLSVLAVAALAVAAPAARATSLTYTLLPESNTANCTPTAVTTGELDCFPLNPALGENIAGITTGEGTITVDHAALGTGSFIDAGNIAAITAFEILVTILPDDDALLPQSFLIDGSVNLLNGARLTVSDTQLGVDFSAADPGARVVFRPQQTGDDRHYAFDSGSVVAEFFVFTDDYASVARARIDDGDRAAIATRVADPAVVPLPGGLPLLLTGAAAAVMLRRRRRAP